MSTLLPGTEVQARGLRWEVVFADRLGQQTLYRLRCLDGGLRGRELDLLHPFEPIEPIRRDLRPERAAPLPHWRVYHQAFLLEQALGPNALLAVQPGRLRLEPYQLVPVVRALRMSRAWHPSKAGFQRGELRTWMTWMRDAGLVRLYPSAPLRRRKRAHRSGERVMTSGF